MSQSVIEAGKFPWSEQPADRPIPTLERRKVVGEKAMVARVVLDEGCVVPVHRHENEQLACVISGKLRFTVGEPGDEREIDIAGGEVMLLPSNVPHGVVALEETVVLDVFTPVAEKMGIDQGRD
ncbi:MAG: cupin domain-containing protein [Phycisphaeraceae bacterium]|nr:cupin domain-containing protein [Phycisphaeraceae bacterium]MCB9848744.1 cupin domain-containing protein [Phycisphaeraceae bacterium]